jgi:NADH-quinone oxidoreductase subunit L
MAGPTPASALIHAATMVAAGVYLVARAYGVFLFAPGVALEVVAVIGGFTALFAASIATLQTDIKKVLAYSTVSQLGYMMMALGAGGYTAGVFHLTTHAFFKSLLFLGSGSVIHAVHTQEMHEMGGLRKKMPITFWTWMIGTAALAGVPFFSGFFSKDEVLLAAYFFHPKYLPEWVGPAVFWGGLATAFLTAYYMTRATILTFFGHPRDHHKYDHAHESPWSMALPLIVLAVPAALAGWIGTSLFGLTNWIVHFIEFEGVKEHEPEKIVMWLAIASALSGIAVGYAIYGLKLVNRKRIIGALKPVYVVLKNKFYVDELYNAVFVKGAVKFSELVAEFDKWVVDGIVNAVGWFGYYWAMASGWFDKTVVDGLVNLTADVTVAGGRQARKISTGYVQAYMLTLVVMVVVGVIIFQVIGG